MSEPTMSIHLAIKVRWNPKPPVEGSFMASGETLIQRTETVREGRY